MKSTHFKLNFSWLRCFSVMMKEATQVSRDRVTLAIIVIIPLIQLTLFGYAINNNPKHLPMVVVASKQSSYTRRLVSVLEATDYFRVVAPLVSLPRAKAMMARGEAQFILRFPGNFTADLLRGRRPQVLLEADGSDPTGVSSALSAVSFLDQHVFTDLLPGGQVSSIAPSFMPRFDRLSSEPGAFQWVVHSRYNPARLTSYYIVPGLLGVVLTMQLVMIASLSITRERERGTMESLLATPVRPVEVMLGKVVPYVVLGYVQIFFILFLSWLLFRVPMQGSLITLLIASLPFVVGNLSVGLMFSSVAKNQLQAVQMAIFFFLPSLLLSGFMFPFYGMPLWAQKIGGVLPLTHFLRLVRGVMLKGVGWSAIWYDVWPIIIFAVLVIVVGSLRYRQTLD